MSITFGHTDPGKLGMKSPPPPGLYVYQARGYIMEVGLSVNAYCLSAFIDVVCLFFILCFYGDLQVAYFCHMYTHLALFCIYT